MRRLVGLVLSGLMMLLGCTPRAAPAGVAARAAVAGCWAFTFEPVAVPAGASVGTWRVDTLELDTTAVTPPGIGPRHAAAHGRRPAYLLDGAGHRRHDVAELYWEWAEDSVTIWWLGAFDPMVRRVALVDGQLVGRAEQRTDDWDLPPAHWTITGRRLRCDRIGDRAV